MEHMLKYLTMDDLASIIEASHRITFARNQVVITQGETIQALYTICSGIARVEADGTAVTRLGPGAVLGEMELASPGRAAASASVVADTELGVDVIEWDRLNNLLISVPGFATRFYTSLSFVLSERLRATTKLVAATMPGVQKSNKHTRRPGQLSDDDLPQDVITKVQAFRAEMDSITRKIKGNAEVDQKFKDRIVRNCDTFHELLRQQANLHTDLAPGICVYMFRQAFPYLMQSYTNNHAYTKPLGYAGDYELLDMICDNKPKGDGRLGELIDKWVLELPFAHAIRERSEYIARLIFKIAKDWGAVVPIPITCLATASSRDVLTLVDNKDAPAMNITCLEMDSGAFIKPAKYIEELDAQSQVSFFNDDLTKIGNGGGNTFLHAQKVIFSSALLDHLEDEQVIELLNWAHERLMPNGFIILGQFHEDNPNRAYLEHILEWPLHYHEQELLRSLFKQSKFGKEDIHIDNPVEGVQMIATCQMTA